MPMSRSRPAARRPASAAERRCAIALLLAPGRQAGAAWSAWARFQAPRPAAEDTTVVIPKGAGSRRASPRLLEEARRRSSDGLDLPARRAADRPRRSALKAGEYALPAGAARREQRAGQHDRGRASCSTASPSPRALTGARSSALFAARRCLEGAAADGSVPRGPLLPETYLFERGDTAPGSSTAWTSGHGDDAGASSGPSARDRTAGRRRRRKR